MINYYKIEGVNIYDTSLSRICRRAHLPRDDKCITKHIAKNRRDVPKDGSYILNKNMIEKTMKRLPPELFYHIAEHLDCNERLELSTYTKQNYRTVGKLSHERLSHMNYLLERRNGFFKTNNEAFIELYLPMGGKRRCYVLQFSFPTWFWNQGGYYNEKIRIGNGLHYWSHKVESTEFEFFFTSSTSSATH